MVMEQAVDLPAALRQALLLRSEEPDQRVRQRHTSACTTTLPGRQASSPRPASHHTGRQVKATVAGPARMTRAGRPPPPTTWSAYIIRRLFAAVVLLLVVSMVTFAIFFLVPRLAGETTGAAGTRYVGQRRQPRDHPGSRAEPRLLRPAARCSTGTSSRASSSAATTTSAPTSRTARRPASATPSRPRSRSGPSSQHRIPVTLSLAIGAAVIWLVIGVAIGVLSALQARARSSTACAMRRRAGRRLAADLLHRPARAGLLQLQAGWTAAGSARTHHSPRTR